ncbi:MAG: OmpA family protein [Nitrospira sp.]|nr:OmpA family protein [Nitrospira sp.]
MIPVRSVTLVGLLSLTALLTPGCSSKSGSLIGQDLRGQEERIAEPAIKEIPPTDAHLTGSRTSPAMQSELMTRNATGLDSGMLADILFDFDQDVIGTEGMRVLDANVQRIQHDRVTHLLLEGRGDDIGTSAYNLVLGERRAKSVQASLQQRGLAVDVITTSYGKDRPLCFEHTGECRQKNRSVHLVIQ